MDLLITGTDGFVGGNLRDHFTAAGFRVHGTVFMREPGPDETRVDLTDPQAPAALAGRRFPVIIHTAGIVDQRMPARLIHAVNAGGTKVMLEYARAAGCQHFIQVSSVSVYGPGTLGEHQDEATSRRNRGLMALPYMRAKALAEEYIEASGIPYTIFRLPAILGRNDTAISGAIIPRLLDGSFRFCGRRDRLVSLICVRNLGPLFQVAIEKGPQNDFFHCVDHQVRWREFIACYAEGLGVPLPTKRTSIVSMLTHYGDKMYLLMVTFSYFGAHYRNEKLMERYAWRPPLDWREAVRDAVAGWRAGH